VAGGTVKFSLQIGNWPFCSGQGGNPCRGATGEFLQFGMEIKGSADASLPDGEKRFTLATDAASGNNITLELSDEVLVDGQWVKMPAGFPRVEFQGSKQLFTFRLPRFSGSALYDPVITGLGSDEPPSAPPPTPPPLPIIAQEPAPPARAPSSPLPSISLLLSASGNVEDYSADVKAALASVIAEAAGPQVLASAVTLDISSASVLIAATIMTSSAAESESVLSALQDEFADAAKATAVLRQAVPTINILETPTIARSSDVEPAPSSGLSGAVIGAVVGACLALVALAVTLWLCCRRGTKSNQGSLAHGAATIRVGGNGPRWNSDGTKESV